MAGSHHAVVAESLALCVFAALAVAGFTGNAWLVVAGLAGHGIFDALHERLRLASSVPSWWPAFCLAFDVTAAVFVAPLVIRGRSASREATESAIVRRPA